MEVNQNYLDLLSTTDSKKDGTSLREDIWDLYYLMKRSRRFEELVKEFWSKGYIPGEMHMGIGEEAIIIGVVSQLKNGDYMALDHRGTAAFLTRGVDPVSLMLEFIGHPDGLCKGNGGHMHLFSKELKALSSGIVGAVGPAAVGFGIAQKYKKNKNIVVGFFGDGAMNQGMLLESLNLAAAWKLPVLFVCKDNDWAITTKSKEVTGGTLVERAAGFGIPGVEIDGMNVIMVSTIVENIIKDMRNGAGPFFLHAHCEHREGHFLGDPLLRFHENTVKEYSKVIGPLIRAATTKGGMNPLKRFSSLMKTMNLINSSKKQTKKKADPFSNLTRQLKLFDEKEKKARLKEIDAKIEREIREIKDKIEIIVKKDEKALKPEIKKAKEVNEN